MTIQTVTASVEKFFVGVEGDAASIVQGAETIAAQVQSNPVLSTLVPIAETELKALFAKYPALSSVDAVVVEVMDILAPLVAKVPVVAAP